MRSNIHYKNEEEREGMLGIKENVLLKESGEKEGWAKNWWREASTGIKDPRQASFWGTAQAAAMLLALGSFGAGAIATKNWADDRDENRQRVKAAEKAYK